MIRRILVVLAPLGLVASVAQRGALPQRELSPIAAHALEDTLVNLEKQSWQAWQRRDGAFFQDFLSEDHVEIGFHGVTRKAPVVAGVASRACVVHSYAIDTFELTRLNPTTALLTYHAAQQTRCNGHAVPSPVWASSLYVRRGDHWLNAMYQQTQALP